MYLHIIGLFEVAHGSKTIMAYPAKQIGKLQLFVSLYFSAVKQIIYKHCTYLILAFLARLVYAWFL